MSADSRFREPTLRQFLQLLVWVRERPEDYCKTVEELHGLLGQLYDFCALADGQIAHFEWAVDSLLTRHGLSVLEELLADHERHKPVSTGDLTTDKVVSFWSSLDHWLGFPSPAV